MKVEKKVRKMESRNKGKTGKREDYTGRKGREERRKDERELNLNGVWMKRQKAKIALRWIRLKTVIRMTERRQKGKGGKALKTVRVEIEK